ncbi:MAG: RNA polymerase sigma factor SigZ [bacterium]
MERDLSSIWSQFNKELYNFILSRVKDSDTAKDILQDSFIKIQKNIIHLKEEKSIKFWIYKITANSIIDHFRAKKYYHEISEDLSIDEEKYEKNSQLAGCILPFINCLPEIYREALLLTEFQNYSQLELADHLSISYSGAKSRVQRAKIKLRELFEKCCNITADPYGNIIDYYPKKKKECC